MTSLTQKTRKDDMAGQVGHCPHCGASYHRQPGDVHGQGPIEYTCSCDRGWNMPEHTNNAAMNKAAKVADKLNANLPSALKAHVTALKAELATLRTLIADYQKAGDSAREMEAQNKALRAEVERLTIQHDEMAAQIMDADVLGMKYKEECERLKADYGILADDYKQLQVDNERLKAELAVQDRAMEIWESYGMDNCPNPNVSVHGDKGCPQELDCTKCIHEFSLAQARAELEQEAKPEPKFKPGETVTHVEYDNPFVVTTCYWDNGMWWYTTGRTLVMAVGEPKLRLVDPKPEALRDKKPEVKP